MTTVPEHNHHQRKRRVPQQSRSRERVERILDAAAELVARDGVDHLSTRGIAETAEIPVASLYQYFADKDEILLALIERDIEAMDQQVLTDLAALEEISIAALVSSTMGSFVKIYHRSPAFVMIWLRGRTNAAIKEYGREHNRRVAHDLFALASDLGLLKPGTEPLFAELAVEMGDRLFQLAFETVLEGDPLILDEAIRLVTIYLETFASDAGLAGVTAPDRVATV